ncbi:MAG: nucleotidyltransferase family protein [Candidatus Thorarchaeota archaeon]
MSGSRQLSIDSLKECAAGVLAGYPIDFAYLFGSVATGRDDWWSDVDLVVSWPAFTKLSSKEQYDSLGRLALELEKETGNQDLDLKVWQMLNLRIQFQILRDGILLLEKKPAARQRAKEDVLLKYPDHMIWFNRYLAEAKKHGRL